MEHTIKAHLSIILEKSLKFTRVWFLTSKTFDVSTLPPLFSCNLAIFDCSKFPYFLNAKSVAYSSIPENEKEINIFSHFWHPWDPCVNSRKKYISVQRATVQQCATIPKTYQLLLESAYQPSILQCS